MSENTANRLLRVFSIVFISGILIFLSLSGVVTLCKEPETTSFYENRKLAPLPDATLSGLLDGSYFTSLDAYLQDHTAGRNTLLRAETIMNLYLLRRPVVNDVVVGNEVLLAKTEYWTYNAGSLSKQVESAADRIAAHARETEKYGGKYYFVTVPHQTLAFSEQMPGYLQSHADYYQDLASAFFPALDRRSVSYLDMWEILSSSDQPDSYSSRIDNHYNMIGAMETYLRLMERINTDTGWSLPTLDDKGWRIEWLPNHFVGSRLRKLFDLWKSEERLGIVVADDEPAFIRSDWSSWLSEPERNRSIYALPETADQLVTYDLYMGGDWASTVIETERSEKPSILIYGDSFTNPVECIIWHDFNIMYSFDFRYYSEETLDQVIARLKPDVVACIKDYDAILLAAGNGQ